VHVIGLTGGIGSGKSVVAAVAREFGHPVVDADEVARRCVAPGTPGLEAVVRRFGDEVLGPDGSLDRARLAGIVFADVAARRDLEAITHPRIRAGIADDLAALRARVPSPPLAVLEHPLLVETGSHTTVDTVVVVEAALPLRLQRLVELRGMRAADARARIAAQTDDQARRAVADHVLFNEGSLADLRAGARDLIGRLAHRSGVSAAEHAEEGRA